MSDFDFSKVKNKNVLKGESKTKSKGGRPKQKVSRKNRVVCYFSDEEYKKIEAFADGQDISPTLRYFIMKNLPKE